MNVELCTISSTDSILTSSVTRFFSVIPNSKRRNGLPFHPNKDD